MSLLEEIIRSESSSASIVFRERPYARVEKQAFVRDVLGLANALVDESRYLILGVKDQGPGERSFSGISDEEIASTLRSSGGDLARAARVLVDEANGHGGEDNITVILMKFEE